MEHEEVGMQEGAQKIETNSRVQEKTTPLLHKKPCKLPLVDRRGRLNVEIRGLPKTFLYWGDLFHTLVNMPNSRFIAILCFTYCLLFFGFAIPYYHDAYNNFCIPGVYTFSHAIWFSVQTSMTIGYGGELTPDPSCLMTNVMVLVQSLASLLVAYALLGVFYVRFSRPARRAQTLIFSRFVVWHEEDGVPIIAFRIANIRKHQIIEASVRLLVGLNNTLSDEDESMFHFTSLPVIGGSQVFLGLPCTVKHPVTSTSPLYGLTIEDLEEADMEILVLLEGVDASTSSKLQARHSYQPSDVQQNYRFETMVIRMPSGRRCVDFTKFDSLLPVTSVLVTKPLTPHASTATLPLFPYGALFGTSERAEDLQEESERGSEIDSLGSSPPPTPTPRSLPGTTSMYALKIPDTRRRTLSGTSPRTVRFDHGRDSSFDQHISQSMPEMHETVDDFSLAAQEAREQAIEHKLAVAEARAQAWKQMVVDRVLQTLQQPLTAADADRGPLLASARQALSMSLSTS